MTSGAHDPDLDPRRAGRTDDALRRALATAESFNFKLDVGTGRGTLLGTAPGWLLVEGGRNAVQDLFDAVHDDDRGRFSLEALTSLRAGDVQEGVFRVVVDDGPIRRLRARIRLLRDDDGKPSTLFGALTDVSSGAGVTSGAGAVGGTGISGRALQERAEAADRRAAIEAAMPRGLEQGDLSVAYQPVLDIWTERPVAAEALARWRHPELGDVAPSEFVPVAEQTGMILALGAWVLHRACHDLARWDVPPGFEVCVNVSGHQLQQPGLEEQVAESLQRCGLRAARLCLEITESVLMEDAPATAAALERLRDLGVRLAIDDFGTGYSSLLTLRDYPAQILKVDQRFVAGVTAGLEDLAIVRATIELAHALGMVALAEGVETPEQMTILRTLGCDLAQGFLWAPPLDPDTFAALLAEGVPRADSRNS